MQMHYPLAVTPEAGSFLEVVQGVYWLRLPLPFELNHINVWLLDDGDGWTLIDAGVSIPATRVAWDQLFATELGRKPLRQLIVTHLHPDHIGLASWHCERFGIDLHATEPTIRRATRLLLHAETFNQELAAEFYRANGAADPDRIVRFASGHSYRRIVAGMPERTHRIDAGMTITIGDREWETIISHGHAEGHLSLYCREEGLLISGDQILPTITSNISLFEDDPDLNPLQQYLDSLEVFRQLPETTLVLPSHGRIFRGLHKRVDAIRAAHMERSALVYGYCREPVSVNTVAGRLFPRQMDEINSCLAFGETFSHLRYLEQQRRVRRFSENGICLFQA
ncbi:MAG: beta-lactamase-like [Gammaproteobacteria bacterium]|nr:beta-lactamase-like [Gammaproteobacteria bacterium]